MRDRIGTQGPISVETFMEACNAFYYATRDPFGPQGDFTTAPEISQMFGEMVGAALADCWARAGSPPGTRYVELGPGRGTLAADALRAMRPAGLDPDVDFVETSLLLRSAQEKAVPGARWHDDLSTVSGGPLLVVANEFLDALPIRQFVGPVERRVTISCGGLAFDRDGDIVERSPARDRAIAELAGLLRDRGGTALIIDYGHSRSAPGDTLQAVRAHGFSPVLLDPGEQDLTAHVDFQRVAQVAEEAGVKASAIVEQGCWLDRLGIRKRAAILSAAAPEKGGEIAEALSRLVDSNRMGALFKVIALHSDDWPVPAGFAAQ